MLKDCTTAIGILAAPIFNINLLVHVKTDLLEMVNTAKIPMNVTRAITIAAVAHVIIIMEDFNVTHQHQVP